MKHQPGCKLYDDGDWNMYEESPECTCEQLCFDGETRTLAAGVLVPVWAFDLASRFALRPGHETYQEIAVEIARARARGREELELRTWADSFGELLREFFLSVGEGAVTC